MGREVAVACVVGTRPEVIKMAPLVRRLARPGSPFAPRVVATAQHRGLLDQALADFDLRADVDLDLMRPGQGLADLLARALTALAAAFDRDRPEIVLAQGDTTTVLAAALASHAARIPFGHVEAGLRTGRRDAPFPEETNRVLVARLADLHFAPTPTARANLVREGVDPKTIHVTGNTGIDALRLAPDAPLPVRPATPRYVLATMHRRESVGAPLDSICRALVELLAAHPGLSLVVPVHPNPAVRTAVYRHLADRDRVHLIAPVGYPAFVALMRAAALIVSDSGGVQEEAPALGTPLVVLRASTERPEALALSPSVRLAGTGCTAILAAAEALLTDPPRAAVSPYGDGRAAERIARILEAEFGRDAKQDAA